MKRPAGAATRIGSDMSADGILQLLCCSRCHFRDVIYVQFFPCLPKSFFFFFLFFRRGFLVFLEFDSS